MTLESQWYFFKTKWDIFNTVGGPFGGPMDLWPPLKIHFKFLFLFFLFFLKISPKGPPVLLSLSFDTIFKRFINNLKQTDKEDPLEDPTDDPLDLEDPLWWPLLKLGCRIIKGLTDIYALTYSSCLAGGGTILPYILFWHWLG